MRHKNVLILLVAITLVSCGGGEKRAAKAETVMTAQVTRGAIEQRVMFMGSVHAKDAVEIFPRATGKIKQKILKEGDFVKRDQPILVAERDEVGYKFKDMPIVSPIDGVVASVDVDVGTNVGPNKPVAIVVSPNEMRIRLDVPERYLEKIQLGTEVTFTVDYLPGEEYKGKVAVSSPHLDEKTRTAKVEILIPNEALTIRHGMFGKVYLTIDKHEDTLIVPYDAISWEGNKRFVYRVEGDKVRRLEVETGFRNEAESEILRGVEEGDVVATSNLINLSDGEEVDIVKGEEGQVKEKQL